MVLLQVPLAVLGGCHSDVFLECRVERRIGIESDCERDGQYCTALAAGVFQQSPGVFNSVTIQVIKEAGAEAGVDNL